MSIFCTILAILMICYGIFCPNIEDKTKTALLIMGGVIGVLCIIGLILSA